MLAKQPPLPNNQRSTWSQTSIILVLLLLARVTLAQTPSAVDTPQAERETLTIPLNDGKVSYGRLARTLLENMGFDTHGLEDHGGRQLDVTKPAGQRALRLITRATRGAVAFEVTDQDLLVTFDRTHLRREQGRLKFTTRLLVASWFPNAAAEAEAAFGMRVHTVDGPATPDSSNLQPHAVVLVHGLDDPGKTWHVLAPTLVREGYAVCEFTYPNDQAVVNSADLLSEHLARLKTLGVDRVTLIGHSMGGLVSREVLTTPDHYAGRGSGHATLPDVARLIMVATPNHGSAMARFRLVGEVREQVERMLTGNGSVLSGIMDGSGEAKADLLPDSEFLKALNARDLPTDVQFTIIAGKASPISKEAVQRMHLALKATSPKALHDELDEAFATLAQFADGTSDGLVTIESTRLAGVDDHVIVEGNHLTVIRNLITSSRRVPPAVPIILERLGKHSRSTR